MRLGRDVALQAERGILALRPQIRHLEGVNIRGKRGGTFRICRHGADLHCNIQVNVIVLVIQAVASI